MSKLTKTRKGDNSKVNTVLPKLDKKAIKAFLQANPSVDLAKVNLLNPKHVQALNWDQQEQAKLLPQLKALQRLIRLTDDIKTAIALYEQGLHAAVQIAAIPEHKFVANYASSFVPNGLSSEEQAKQVHQRALARKSQALITYTALVQHQSPHYRATRFDNLSAPTATNYNNLPSYQDLFGDLDFCSCEECQSIYSPAAYFVDLMRLQENYIDKDPNSPPAQLLKDRRPDLWEIPLDCSYTNTLVPKLEIVNKVLLKTLGGNVSYEKLTTTNYPFNLPFHLPLTEMELYLSSNKQSLARIWQTLNNTTNKDIQLAIARQSLQISPEQWTLYSNSQANPDILASLYGCKSGQNLLKTLTVVDNFLVQTGLTYVQLQELVYEDLGDEELNKKLNNAFFINSNLSGIAKEPIGIDVVMSAFIPAPNVSMSEASSGVVYKNQLYCFYQDVKAAKPDPRMNAVGYSIYKLDNQADWSNRVMGGMYTSDSPTIVNCRDKTLYSFFQGSLHDTRLWCCSSENGQNWSPDNTPEGIKGVKMTKSPSAVVFKDRIYCFYQEVASTQIRHISRAIDGHDDWDNQGIDNVVTSASPSVLADKDERLYCFFQVGGALYYCSSTNGKDWGPGAYYPIPGISVYGSPSAIIFEDKLYCFYHRAEGQSPSGELWYVVQREDGSGENKRVEGVVISESPNVVTFQKNLYCFYQMPSSGSNGGNLGCINLQLGQDRLTNLTLERLDHIHRFIRLAQALGWSFTDLDWALRTVGAIVNITNNGAPIINDDALPYLAWMQSLIQQYKFSVNQCCALMGTLKDFGQKDGPTFFDQVFNNPTIPNRPDWKKNNYSLVWNVPRLSDTVLSFTQDIQIQNALAAALKLGQDDLIRIAKQVLESLSIKDAKLPLTLANLSILYRLSQLPALTGLSIQECFTALQLPGQPTEALLDLVSILGDKAQASLVLLQQFAQWLQTTPFSVYQLEFILTGVSQDPIIENQVLGEDKIANFLAELRAAIQPTLLTEKSFVTVIYPSLQNLFGSQTGDLGTQIYKKLKDKKIDYIDENGVVTATGVTAENSQLIKVLQAIALPLMPPNSPEDGWNQVITYIVDLLKNSYQVQQATLTHQLASLYNISPNLVHALEVWGGLTLGDLEASQMRKLRKPNPYASVPLLQKLLASPAKQEEELSVLLAEDPDINERLKVLQQYAALLQTLALSPAETQAMLDDPGYFGITYKSGIQDAVLPQFTLVNIQTLYQFKQLIQGFQDTENHLLDYFGIASVAKDLGQVAEALSQFTEWDKDQIQFLLQQLWPVAKKRSKSSNIPIILPVYATIAGIKQLQAYFTIAQQLNIDVATLWQLTKAIDPLTDYTIYQILADALWAGLQKQYENQPDQISALQNTLHEAKRSALLELTIYQLRTQKSLPIMTARDLYEYLLIDVEVSGILQTSYVKEAISAVQLYIYRCFNSLESDIKVHQELSTWWPWLEKYRVWQANREVFLYPENYIQPELRKDKTPQFTQLENDLQQSKLNAETIETAVRSYLDGFAEVANLEIVGSYLYANDASNPPNQQTLYLVGRTHTKAYKYYYRSATFVLDQDTYVATAWTPWVQINLQIKSSLVSPVYAFGRLFLFWIETKPDTSSDDTKKKRFNATLYYSFYDFNKRWSSPQQMLDPIILPESVNTQADSEAVVWQQIRVIFDLSDQLIYWAWGEPYSLYAGVLNQKLSLQSEILYEKIMNVNMSSSPDVVFYKDKLYFFHQGYGNNQELWYSVLDENGFWEKDIHILSNDLKIVNSPSAVVYQGVLYCFYQGSNHGELWGCFLQENGTWKNYLVKEGIKIWSSPSAVVYQDKLYCFYEGVDGSSSDKRIHYLIWENGNWSNDSKIDGVYLSNSPSVVVYQNKLYCFHQGHDNNGELWYVVLDANGSWEKDVQILPNDVKILNSPNPVVYHGKLYCFYQGAINGELWYCVLEGNDKWSNYKIPYVGILESPSAIEYQDQLYCFYQSKVEQWIPWYSKIFVCKNNIREGNNQLILTFLGFLTESSKVIPYGVVPSLDLTWTIEPGPDGTQFLSIPTKGKDKKKEIRLNSMVVHELSQTLFSEGMDGFLSLDTQKTPEINIDGTKTSTLDFIIGANGLYYWELFFHMPLLVAHSLSVQQQFELAKKWYEYIFDPTMNHQFADLIDKNNPNDKYWQFLMLRAQYNSILKTELHQTWEEETQVDLQNAAQLAAYHDDPFDPHAIARLRPIAYQKTLVMHYIDNLLAWGDNLFRQYTIETIVEATMLYVMAYDLLGKQPVSLGPCALPDAENLEQIASHYQNNIGLIPEFLIQVEQAQSNVLVANVQDTPHNYIAGDYFGLPENEQFVAYWEKVKQRLYNIRHNLNIDGIYQKLPLFEPRINPMQLVQAIASGEGISQALVENQLDVPYYRFSVMMDKAQSLIQTVIQLGQSLLAVLEKQDAERLTLLYSMNQQNLLALTRTSKEDQLEVATQTVASLQASLQNAQDRVNHYTNLLNNGLSAGEQAQIDLESYAIVSQVSAQAIKGASIAGYSVPTVYGLAAGGMHPGDAVLQGANILEGGAQSVSMSGGLAATIAGYQRREEDWQLQQTLAQDDIEQVQYQIVAAQYQEQIAKEEIKLLEKQIEQEQAVEAFLKNKFTRAQLYQWMTGKLAALYFQAYQLAYSVALQAEKAWQFECCKELKQPFIHATYWEDLYQGLVAGEALQLDLQRMEKAYMDQDERRLEIQKTISLAQLDSGKVLTDLKNTGSCVFEFSEKSFGSDYPGHYCRQIKSISVSFPALLGPYQDIHATLTQTGSKTVLKADIQGVRYLLGSKGAERPDSKTLRVDMRANQQVALSQGINDDGLFVLNFEDARYLPFEGTGAVSSWRLDMPDNPDQLFANLTDVIIRLQYTALAGGKEFQTMVKQSLGNFEGRQSLIMNQHTSA